MPPLSRRRPPSTGQSGRLSPRRPTPGGPCGPRRRLHFRSVPVSGLLCQHSCPGAPLLGSLGSHTTSHFPNEESCQKIKRIPAIFAFFCPRAATANDADWDRCASPGSDHPLFRPKTRFTGCRPITDRFNTNRHHVMTDPLYDPLLSQLTPPSLANVPRWKAGPLQVMSSFSLAGLRKTEKPENQRSSPSGQHSTVNAQVTVCPRKL
jgi:hypothetical protein